MEAEAPSWKEERGLIISIYFQGVFGAFPGMSNTALKGLGEDGGEEEENYVEEEDSNGIEVFPASVGPLKVLGGNSSPI
ncbi:hypothetical protein O181_027304 [Austropuccinia psidii MF-1]|uniref:Uncharacterized protein n=1 Tax=Austropuccinia psidii MF-1 TaxID=1389203 RepID=A0A9Q3CLR6_9BASI|nr:hypothetical protein [Austropuccinia psidii MF-1]